MGRPFYEQQIPKVMPVPPESSVGSVTPSPEVKIRILRLPEVISRVGLKRASIYQYVSDGRFPKPVSLGPRAVGWIEVEIDAWLAARIQKTRSPR